VELVAPLCTDGRELVLVELVDARRSLGSAPQDLERLTGELADRGVEARSACFTSASAEADLALVANEQAAELVVVADPLPPEALATLVDSSPCDVAVAPRQDLGFEAAGPVLVPFGGAHEEWAALEVATWIARRPSRRPSLRTEP
jgi:hypothetical protein